MLFWSQHEYDNEMLDREAEANWSPSDYYREAGFMEPAVNDEPEPLATYECLICTTVFRATSNKCPKCGNPVAAPFYTANWLDDVPF
jgi:hypothetical protein